MPIICISLHWRFLNENIHSIVYFVKSRFPNSRVFVSRFFQETGLVLITPYLSQVTASLAKIIKVYRDHSPLVSTLVVLVLHKKSTDLWTLLLEPISSSVFLPKTPWLVDKSELKFSAKNTDSSTSRILLSTGRTKVVLWTNRVNKKLFQ